MSLQPGVSVRHRLLGSEIGQNKYKKQCEHVQRSQKSCHLGFLCMHVLPNTCSCRHFVCSGQVCLLPLSSLSYARVLYYSISYSLFHRLHLLLLSSLLLASCLCYSASLVIFPCLLSFFYCPSPPLSFSFLSFAPAFPYSSSCPH
jgi:hypothetical protein